ncbi:uncharacterized protein YjbI with pentapeptide repeats [Oxalobacteraceae bacterium GrIS 2.11]
MIGLNASVSAVTEALTRETPLPSVLIQIVNGYSSLTDFSDLALEKIKFDVHGHVINPEIRELYKEAFMSSYCHPAHKTFLLFDLFQDRETASDSQLELQKNELRKIFDEIATSGYRVYLDGVKLSNVCLSGLNLQNASMIGARITESVLENVDLGSADLTDTEFISTVLLHVNLQDTVQNKQVQIDLNTQVSLEDARNLD